MFTCWIRERSKGRTALPWWPPKNLRQDAIARSIQPDADAIQVMTMKVSKGLEFPVVALPGIGHMPAPGEDEKEAVLVFYVAATRATQRLAIAIGGDGAFRGRLDCAALRHTGETQFIA